VPTAPGGEGCNRMGNIAASGSTGRKHLESSNFPLNENLLHNDSCYLWYVKLLSLLFALYFSVLAGYPCTDADERANADVAFHMQHNQAGADQCSPFCICSCCATSVQLTAEAITLTVDRAHNSKFITPYLDKHVVHNQSSVWQPPRQS